MAKFANVNETGTHRDVVWWIKETLKLAGWTVQNSSDGTTYNASGDQWATVADSMNANAWLVIEDPAGRRQYLLKHAAVLNDDDWYVGYSSLDKFVTGSPGATTTPTATDEAALHGTLSGQVPSDMFGSTSQNHRIHVVAESTPISGVYPFWCYSHLQGGGSGYFGWIVDPLLPDSFPPEATPAAPTVGDADPLVQVILPSAFPFVMAGGVRGYTAFKGWYKYNYGDQAYVNYAGFDYGVITDQLNTNPYSGNVEGFPLAYLRTAAQGSQVGWRGFGAFAKFAGDIRVTNETVNLNSGAYIHVGDLLLPWPDNVAPLIHG